MSDDIQSWQSDHPQQGAATPPAQPPSRHPKRAVAAVVAGVVAAAAVGAGIAMSSGSAAKVSAADRGAAGSSRYLPGFPGRTPMPQTPRRGYRDLSIPSGSASKAQQVGVVDIYTVLNDGSQAAGTGMVLTPRGEILTNNHVVNGSTRIRVVVVSSGKVFTARVRGTDSTDDIAVLQLKGASHLATVTVDSSGGVQRGDKVTGVGNAGGVGGTPSAAAGTVRTTDASITVGDQTTNAKEHLSGMIKIAADIQSGDSGGPLYNADNSVIGIDTAASSGQSPVLGFAIPISRALGIASKIDSGSESATITIGYPAFLGVELSDAAATPAQGSRTGATIAGVIGGLAADRAGLAPGDTITAIDGQAVTSSSDLSTVVKSYHPGDSVTVRWTSPGGATHSATVVLTRGPAA